MWSKLPAPLVRELHHRADVLLGDDDRGADVRLLDALELARHLRRVVHLELLAHPRLDAVGDVRRRHEQVEVELPLEPLAHDLHVEQAEEAAAEAEAERLRRLRLVEQRPVVELQPLERVAQLGVLVGVRREEPREDHRLHVLVAGQRLGGAAADGRQRVADAQPAHVLEPGDHVADLARGRALGVAVIAGARKPSSSASKRVPAAIARRAPPLSERPVDDAHERDDAAVLVVRRVEDQRARRRVGVALGRRDPLDDGVERRRHPLPRLRGDAEHVIGRVADELGHLGRDLVRAAPAAGRSCSAPGRSRGCSRSRDTRSRASAPGSPATASTTSSAPSHAASERDTSYVKSTWPGRVDQVELVALPGHAHRLRLDRDPALALELHRVEQLLAHLAPGHGLRQLEDAVGERRLAVVDVRDDREVADPGLVHGQISGAATQPEQP